MKILTSAQTDVGLKRDHNEDYYVCDPDRGIFLVADGMGGHSGGEVASRLAGESIPKYIQDRRAEVPAKILLEEALNKANEIIYDKACSEESLHDMGTTVVLTLISKNRCHFAHVGDSRLYLIRGQKIRQLTKDHSLVQEKISQGLIREDEVEEFGKKNIITRSVGTEAEVKPDIDSLAIREGDILLMCSDGLIDLVTDEEILDIILNNEQSFEGTAEKLIRMANSRGGKDNITAVVLKVTEMNDKHWAKYLVTPMTAVLVLGLVGAGAYQIFKQKGGGQTVAFKPEASGVRVPSHPFDQLTPTVTPELPPSVLYHMIAASPTPTHTMTSTPTSTPTFTMTPTRTHTPDMYFKHPTITPTGTHTYTRTQTPTSTATRTYTPTPTLTPTHPPAYTKTPTSTSTSTITPIQHPTITLTRTNTPTCTSTPTHTLAYTKTPIPTPTSTPIDLEAYKQEIDRELLQPWASAMEAKSLDQLEKLVFSMSPEKRKEIRDIIDYMRIKNVEYSLTDFRLGEKMDTGTIELNYEFRSGSGDSETTKSIKVIQTSDGWKFAELPFFGGK